ncbi:carboxypeptidase M32 [Candidatus Protochlamydia sp. R18]|uniref:carboxypeptidase M32 n=1 Tax=Candidatus Protochlamydia sp. R18 TaxID=1353977 RepID=UPI0005A659A0|nr:carboxypeptidase M32 [Candidatus Protochlamydia sp. R18]
MSKTQKEYQKLHVLSKHARILQGISSHLDWDQETYMPSGSAAIRAEQLKTMAGLIHREKTSQKFANTLSKLIDLSSGELIAQDLTPAQSSAVKEWRRDYLQDTAMPAEFVEEFAQLTSQSVLAWRNAKKSNSFQQFAPFLDRVVTMNRKKADLLGYQNHPYDALLDLYEPDMTTAETKQIFDKLKNTITVWIRKISTQKIENNFLFGKWDHDKQIAFSHQILNAMGYDFNKGRLDFSSHPFSSASHPTDSRITTRIHPSSLMSNISVVLHEGGHALYEMGLPQNLYGTPLGDARSLGIHESQSRWWETRIGLHKSFWKHFFPILKNTFPGRLDQVHLNSFYQAINKVEPSFIRVEADEMTYPLHVIIRFELEKALIEGSINVREVPEAWNAKMKEYLGITPSHHNEGCLQDIHWSMGAFGYFPTYTLGNLYAAHLFEAFAKQYPDWEQRISIGELDFVKAWLSEHIYQHGRRYSSRELLKLATGHAFNANAYLRYLQDKYSQIYQL